MTGPRFPEEEEREGRKSRADGCFPASCSEQEHEREEAWRGRRPCSLPSDRRLSSFSLDPCLHPLKSSHQLRGQSPTPIPTSPRAPALFCFFTFHDPSFSYVHWALFLFPLVYIYRLDTCCFASVDPAGTLGRPRRQGILVDPPAGSRD